MISFGTKNVTLTIGGVEVEGVTISNACGVESKESEVSLSRFESPISGSIDIQFENPRGWYRKMMVACGVCHYRKTKSKQPRTVLVWGSAIKEVSHD